MFLDSLFERVLIGFPLNLVLRVSNLLFGEFVLRNETVDNKGCGIT